MGHPVGKTNQILRPLISTSTTSKTTIQNTTITLRENCQIIRISLRNDVLEAQGTVQGKYELSTTKNDESPVWISASKAIWLNSKVSYYFIE